MSIEQNSWEIFFGDAKKNVPYLCLIIYLSFLPSSHSVPKALSALATSDTDEEDQESTPVITNGNGESAAVASAKPTAPAPSENDGKSVKI